MKKLSSFFMTIAIVIWLGQLNDLLAQSPIWTLPNKYLVQGLPINLPTPTGTDVYTGQQSQYAHNAGYNPVTGELMFFIVDNYLFDDQGYLINILYDANHDDLQGMPEIAIVPDPGNCKRYYIFAGNKRNLTSISTEMYMYYYILDLSVPRTSYNTNRTGDLIQLGAAPFSYTGNIKSLIPAQDYPNTVRGDFAHVAVSTPNPNTGSRLIVLQLGNSMVYHFELSQTGLTYLYVIDPYTGAYPTFPIIESWHRSELEIIRVENRYRIGGQILSGQFLFAYDVDFSGGIIPNSHKTLGVSPDPFVRAKGIEFSENGAYMYFTHVVSSQHPKAIECWDIANSSLVQLPAIVLSQMESFQYSQIEMAQDGKMYVATSNRLASLSNTNNPTAVVWNNNELSLTNYNISNLGLTNQGGASLYTLPDQIDNQDCVIGCFDACSSSSIETSCCEFYNGISDNSVGDIKVSSTTTWSPGAQSNPFGSVNGEVYFSGNIIVEPGVVLTLEGMTLHFSPTSKVIVSRAASTSGVGAKLVAKNSILTVDDRCGTCSMWPGVEVHGYSTAAQSFPHQPGAIHNSPNGSIHVIANSKIEHALRGILVGRTSGPNNFIDSQYSGGMVGVDQSTFFNNEVDVQFAPYTQLNRSFFNRSTFITDGLLNDLTRTPWFHLGLFGVDNINIKGCTFVNETPTVYAANQQGIGIASINSRFFVDAFCGILTNCPNPIRSVFHDLTDGVIAMGFLNSMPFTVDRSDFLNNHTGIYASNVNNFRIQRNVFEVYKSVAPNYTFETRGIHILNSTGYIVQENNLYESTESGISGQGETVGIMVDNSGTAENEIYKNSFRNLKVGGKSLRINSEPYPFSNFANNKGLVWKCNNFAQDMYQADLGVASGRIAYQQGHCLASTNPIAVRAAAGNIFSHSGNNSENDFWLNPGVLEINYAHHADIFTTPIDHSNLVLLDHCSTDGDVYYNPTTSCPTRIRTGVIGGPIGPIGAIIGGLRSEIFELEQSIEDKEERLNEGNSAALLDMIANTAISHGDRKNALIAASPLLSDEVLVAYVLSTPPAGHLTQVISANSPVSPTVWSEIEALSIPRGIKRQLENLQQGVSERTYLVNELGYEKTERSVLVNELLAMYWMDTTLTDAKENIKLILENEHTGAELHRTMVEYYLKIHAIDQAQSSLDAYIALAGYDEFVKLAQYAIASSPVNCLFKGVKEDSQKRDEIKDIADNMPESRYCSSAQTLLEYALNESYERYTEPLIMSMSMMQQLNSNTAENNITTDENVVQIFPNPASSEFFVVLDLPSEDLNTVTVDLYTLTGQKVNSVNTTDRLQLINMDVSHLSEGMYLVIVTVDGEELSRQKVAVK